jgi:general secretion pathway protein M
MIATLPPAASRALAVALLLGAAGILYLGLAQPLIADYRSTQQAISDMRADIARYRRVGAEAASRKSALAALRQQQATTEGFLPGANDALAAAQMQNRVKALAESVHGELKSTQVLPVQDDGRYRRVTIRAQMVLNLASAQKVLYGLETASPLLFVDNLNMRSRLNDRRRERTPSANAEDPLLDLRFDVYGFMRNNKTSQDQPAPGARPEAAAGAFDVAKTGGAAK